MAETKHKKRGSNTTLLLLLLVLIGITVAIFMWPTEEPTPLEPTTEETIAEAQLVAVGDKAPDFNVMMLDGSSATLSDNQDKPTLLLFWATTCGPCREELSHLQTDIIDTYGDALRVLIISTGEKREAVTAFVEEMGYTFNVGVDSDQVIYGKYAKEYIPRSFLIDASGTVTYLSVGYDETVAADLDQAIKNELQL